MFCAITFLCNKQGTTPQAGQTVTYYPDPAQSVALSMRKKDDKEAEKRSSFHQEFGSRATDQDSHSFHMLVDDEDGGAFGLMEDDEKAAGEVVVYNPSRIRRRYLKTWFLIDFFSTFPFELVAQVAMFILTPRSFSNF